MKFGKVETSLIPRTGPRNIYRDGVKVGEWPDSGYIVVIHGHLSSGAATLEAAQALAEYYGWTSNPRNMRTRPPVRRYAMTPDDARAYVLEQEADSAALMAAFPFTPREVAQLKASRHHSDILEPTPPDVIERRIARLSAPIPLY